MKPVDVNDNTYIDCISKEGNDKDPKFKVGAHVRIFKYKNIFAKGCTPDWSEDVFEIQKYSSMMYMLLKIEMGMKLLGYFMKKEYKRLINKNLG